MGCRLVYCDPQDTLLGIGVDRFTPQANDPTQWRGENILGDQLQRVRNLLLSDPSYKEEVELIKKGKTQEMKYKGEKRPSVEKEKTVKKIKK